MRSFGGESAREGIVVAVVVRCEIPWGFFRKARGRVELRIREKRRKRRGRVKGCAGLPLEFWESIRWEILGGGGGGGGGHGVDCMSDFRK